MAQTSARELLRNIASIRRGERLLTSLMFLWFFITICAYYVIRPVRSSLFLTDYGPYALPWVYIGSGVVTGVAVYVYSKFAGMPRRRLISAVLLVFVSNFFAWWWVARQAEAATEAGTAGWGWTAPTFYFWTDVYSIMAVTIFWMYANDVFPPRSAKRIFGVIGAAGPLGGIAGAWITESVVPHVGTVNMILVGAAIYLLVLLIFLALEVLTRGQSAERGAAPERFEKAEANLSELPAVVRLIASSRFLLLLTLVVCLERMVPDFADFIQSAIGKAAFPARDAYTEWFAGVEKWRNVAAFFATLFLTAAILNLAGVRFALSSSPVTILVMSVVFLFIPVLGVAVLLKNLEEGQRHTWFKAAKEVTYTTTSREVIYRVKAYIEMFFYRLSRGVAGFIQLLIVTVAGLGPRAVAAAAIPLGALWIYCAWNLGKEYERLEPEAQARAPAGAQQPAPVT